VAKSPRFQAAQSASTRTPGRKHRAPPRWGSTHRARPASSRSPSPARRSAKIIVTKHDDASQDFALFIQDEDACLGTLLARHNAYYRSPAARGTPGFESPQPQEVALSTQVIEALAKVLLYLNLPEAEQRLVPERSDLERRLRQLGPKKAARFKRRLAKAYDRILIGPGTYPEAPTEMPAGAEPHHSPRPHWRRGHFRRIRYGEQLSEHRLGWIRPVLVNAAEAFAPVKAKP